MSKTNPINSIICGDCRDRMMEYIPDDSIDLIYLDPPFFSGKDYDLIWKKRGSKDGVKKTVFGDEKGTFGKKVVDEFGDDHSSCVDTVKCFEEAGVYKKVCGECGREWGITANGEPYERCIDRKCNAPLSKSEAVRKNDVEIYVGWLRERLEECHRVLKSTGSIYVHLDWHAVHYVKVMMDDVFGMKNFRNEIVWEYGKGIKSSSSKFISNHDTILFYVKSNQSVFNVLTIPYTAEQLKRFKHTDEIGKYYYDTRRDKNGEKKKVKVRPKEGTPIGDVWYYARVQGNERLGYPTQKPESLLECIIKAGSNEGDTILDPFCGCGTAVAVAKRLGRKYIGIDNNPRAIEMTRKRVGDINEI